MIPHKTFASLPRDIFSGRSSDVGRYIPMPHTRFLGSGRAALQFAVGKGNVGVPAFTCAVVVEAILRAGANPVFFDSGVVIQPEALEEIAHRIDAVVLPYNFGFIPDMKSILRICRRHDIEVIEDCALALGATYDDSVVGSFGERALWSFDFSKSAGIGGGLLGSRLALQIPPLTAYPKTKVISASLRTLLAPIVFSPSLYRFLRLFVLGSLPPKLPALLYEMSPFGKTVLQRTLSRYEEILALRRMNGEYACQELQGIIPLVTPVANSNPTWHSVVMLHSQRNQIMQDLRAEGIEVFPWHTYKDNSPGLPLASQTQNEFMVFDTLRPQWQMKKFVQAVKKVMK